MGSSSIVGLGVSSTTAAATSTSKSNHGNFSLWSTPIVNNVPSSSQSKASPSNMGQASGIVPGSAFYAPTCNPNFSNNPNVGFPYGWNWTSSASVISQAAGPSYSGFGHNLGGFTPSCGPPIGGSGDPFQPTPMGAGPNLQMQGGSNVPLQQPPLGPKHTPNPSNQGASMVPMGNPYQMGGYQSMPQPYRSGYPYPPNQYMGGHMARLISILCCLSTRKCLQIHNYLCWLLSIFHIYPNSQMIPLCVILLGLQFLLIFLPIFQNSKVQRETTLLLTLPLIIYGVSPTPCWMIQSSCIFSPAL